MLHDFPLKNHNPKVLLVDQKPDDLLLWSILLSDLDIAQYQACDGNDAIKLTFEHDFSLIIMNTHLPKLNGFEVAKYLQSFENTKAIPIFFVSNESLCDENNKNFKSIINAECFIQPINDKLLAEKACNAINQFEQDKAFKRDRFDLDLSLTPEPVIRIQQDQIVFINEAMKQTLKLLSLTASYDSLSDLFQSMPEQLDSLNTFIEEVLNNDTKTNYFLNLSFETDGFYDEYRVIPCYVRGENHEVTLLFHDVSDIKNEMIMLSHQAFHDLLTGCLNRRALEQNYKLALDRQKRNNTQLSLMMIDLDNFKVINDTAGHDAGDFVLKQAVERIKECLRDVDTLYRLGGDEFCILIEDTEPLEALKIPAQRIIDSLNQGFVYNRRVFSTGASIGVASTLMDVDSKELIKYADKAMYEAKKNGKGKLMIYMPEQKLTKLEQSA